MDANTFSFTQFIDDAKNSLIEPKAFFASMPKHGGLGEPIIKALLFGFISGLITLAWTLLNLSPGMGLFGQAFGSTIGVAALIGSVIVAFIGLFIGALIVLIASAFCGGTMSYETCARVTAAMMVLSPVHSLFGFLFGMNVYAGMAASLAVSLYGIWMMYNALTEALSARESTAKAISIVFAVLIVIISIGSMSCYNMGSVISEQYKKEIENNMNIPQNEDDPGKMIEEYKKMMEKEIQKNNTDI